MADGDETEVKEFTERVEIQPAKDDDDELEDGDTSQESSPDNEGEEGEGETPAELEPEHIETPTPAPAPPASIPQGMTEDDLKEVPGETPRERALRLEVTRLKRNGRDGRISEMVTPPQRTQGTPALDEAETALLAKYKPEELSSLREVLPVLAKEMGFVRKDELDSSTFEKEATTELNNFLEAHPEYLPENDQGDVLWNRLKEEFSQYKPPASPQAYKKLLNRIHQDVFGIQPTGALPPKVTAQVKKVDTASHTGPTTPPAPQVRTRPVAQGAIRTDMLKGFTAEDLKEMGLE